MKKICSKCKELKSYTDFPKMGSCSDGLYPSCIVCKSSKDRDSRRTKHGLLTCMYKKQRSNSKHRGHAMPNYSKAWLKEWLFSQDLFHKLHSVWEKSNYERKIMPSIDRIDSKIGYKKDNIQLMTWIENCIKGNR